MFVRFAGWFIGRIDFQERVMVMGICFSHGDANWSYSGFDRFRCKLAESIGIEFHDMIGYGGHKGWNGIRDDIKPLLNHSDCDGELTPEECQVIYPRLLKLIADWPQNTEENDYDYYMGLELAKGLKQAADLNEPFKFM